MSDGKARSACERCHAAKVKCDRNTPCARCEKKGFDCTYILAKSARSNERDSEIVASLSENLEHGLFSEHDKKTWAVFFALFKKFKDGCPAFWFSKQLTKMLGFLEYRAAHGNRTGIERLREWSHALSVELPAVSPNKYLRYHHFEFQEELPKNVAIVHKSVDDMRQDAMKKNEPVLSISVAGVVEVNDQFVAEFRVSHEEMQRIISEADGGFLPWGGDAISRIASTERDLSLYIQSVAMNFEQLGPPVVYPSVRMTPSAHVINVNRRGVPTRCIVRAMQTEHINSGNFTVSSTFAFEFPEDKLLMVEVPKMSSSISPQPETNCKVPPANYDVHPQIVDAQQMHLEVTPHSAPQLSSHPSLLQVFGETFGGSKASKRCNPSGHHVKQPIKQQRSLSEEEASELESGFSEDDEKWLNQLLSWADVPDQPRSF